MGMFDYLKCEVPLPDGKPGGEYHQTKDFECVMAHHVITADGRLMLDHGHCVEVPKAERPHPNAPDGSLESFMGSVRWIPNLRDANWHGWVYFDDYRAKFTDGKLVCIEMAD